MPELRLPQRDEHTFRITLTLERSCQPESLGVGSHASTLSREHLTIETRSLSGVSGMPVSIVNPYGQIEMSSRRRIRSVRDLTGTLRVSALGSTFYELAAREDQHPHLALDHRGP